jgi:hypothetical protein
VDVVGVDEGVAQVIETDALPITHHQRARREVSQPLAAAVDEQRQHADGIEDRKEVDDAYQVADRSLPKSQRLAVVADHTQAGRALAEGLPVPGGLADQEVARQQDEAEDDLDQDCQLAGTEDAAQ